jgi:hypothetical protein
VQFRLHCGLACKLEDGATHVFRQNIATESQARLHVVVADCCGSSITGGGGGTFWVCPNAAEAQSMLNRMLNCRICLMEAALRAQSDKPILQDLPRAGCLKINRCHALLCRLERCPGCLRLVMSGLAINLPPPAYSPKIAFCARTEALMSSTRDA